MVCNNTKYEIVLFGFRLQAVDSQCVQKTRQQASLLLSQLKDCYKHQENKTTKDDKNTSVKRSILRSPQFESRNISYSQKLIARSKAVKEKQKSDDAIRDKEKESNCKAIDKDMDDKMDDKFTNELFDHHGDVVNGKSNHGR